MLIDGLLKIIESCLPLSTAIEGDKVGLQIQSGKTEVKNILITLEITKEVIVEAKENNIDCIITYHPLIYNPITCITESNRVGYLVRKLIQNSIAVVSVHTTFDTYFEGTSRILSNKLGLEFKSFLIENEKVLRSGLGVISYSEKPLKPDDFINRLYNLCNSPITYCTGKVEQLRWIGIVGGSGSEFIERAIEEGCDAFVCSDISYHKFHQSKGRIWLINVGHYEMEQFVPEGLYNLFQSKLGNEDFSSLRISRVITNPVNYFPNNELIDKQKEYLLKIK